MKTKIKIIATNELLKDLYLQEFDAHIEKHQSEAGNMHIICAKEKDFLFDLKDTKIFHKVTLWGHLVDGQNVGNVVLELN